MKKSFFILSISAVALGIILRFVFLSVSFEYDELFTAVTSNPQVPFSYIWTHYLMVDVHPPLHNALLWVYNHFVPYGPEWTLRLPSLLFGLLALWEGWKFFPRYLGRTNRWLFLLLLSCNFYLILYAQHARAYSLILCAAIPFTFLYLKFARCIYKNKTISLKQWFLYGFLALVLCWSHYFGALFFGLCSTVLFVLAWYYKRNLKFFIIIPLAVFILFLPWLIPNLLQNISQSRFSGNWWATPLPFQILLYSGIEFFFSSALGLICLIFLGIMSILKQRFFPDHHKKWPYKREIFLLLLPIVLAAIFVLIMSIKIFWVIWRYFIPFMPCLYLFICLLIGPLYRKNTAALGLFLLFVAFSFRFTLLAYRPLVKGGIFHSRGAMQLFQKAFPDKELFVVAIEDFPQESMVPMYSFYLHHQFGMNTKVTEVYSLDKEEFEKIADRQQDGVFWMPNCMPDKMEKIISKWGRRVGIFARYEVTCFLLVAGKDKQTIDPKLQDDYQGRFIAATKQLLAESEKR